MWRIALLSTIALITTACLGSDFEASVEGSWQLTAGTVNGQNVPVLDSHPITIVFDGERVSGTAACNGYSGSYRQSGAAIEFGALAMTEMACMPPAVMEAEQRFAEGLILVDEMSIDGAGTLTLSGEGVELEFESS